MECIMLQFGDAPSPSGLSQNLGTSIRGLDFRWRGFVNGAIQVETNNNLLVICSYKHNK